MLQSPRVNESIGCYTEKEVHKAFSKKLFKGQLKKGRSKDPSAIVSIDNVIIAKVKIPNPHSKTFNKGKARVFMRQLRLDNCDYNGVVKCSINSNELFEIIVKNFSELFQ
ncbi:hypothetical protein KAJ27_05110 [bacterium]|nr:hypothetical protein [bacterium]